MVKVDELLPHPQNPRRGDVDSIVESIRQNGWYGTVVAQRSTSYVLAGNHRLMAAKELDIDEVPVYWVDVDDATATRVLLADNRLNDRASYDTTELVSLLTQVRDDDTLLGTGWDASDLADLMMTSAPITIDVDEHGEWSDDDGKFDDSRRSVILNLEASLADEFENYIDAIGSHDAAISAFLEGNK